MNEIANDQRARIAAMGRKPITDLVTGDMFSHSYYGERLEFLSWCGHTNHSGIARCLVGGRVRYLALNPAGSVKIL